ncbi:TonB-dependent receptor [Alloacidobacterium dinghuense]|uniref:TonB-dependent receptor n=1 Tax=Alloacidobacterium dinghuense TaxID=2763107 RepID=A0A7G8BM61_9BACT|nr:TonB-dependent receptor [Alloacidobacterium dinghuense]QNI33631.1 TonB-dependent receptor [Alloacidobacterium dinghuense]
MQKFFAVVFLLLCSTCALAQVDSGELRVRVLDPSGAGVKVTAQLTNKGSGYSNTVTTDPSGAVGIQRLAYGRYLINIDGQGFDPVSQVVEVRSAIPVDLTIKLKVAPVTTEVTVNNAATLIDPDRPNSVMQIGEQQIDQRLGSLPGRSVQDLVNTQPGWLYEGNAVLHPRGSEYQTQFVIDGVPLTDNRSPAFGPEIEADSAESMNIYTAGIPAEYGRKMGGVVELNTKQQADQGLHGQAVLSGGSYDSASGYAQAQYVWGKNSFGGSADGSRTGHYLNPVVPENYTNNGTTGDFSTQYERNFTDNDRLILGVRHELARYEIPNELIQQQAGQLQNSDNFETMGTVSYQHVFSADMVGNLSGMVRNNANNFYSNTDSTPIIVSQHNYFNEGYFKGTISIHHRNQEWKAGVESDNTFLNEDYSHIITNPDDFDPSTPQTFSFTGNRPDLEQAAFVEDLIRLGNWTLSAGLRWDHYQLLLNQNHFSPRVAISRYFQSANLVAHISYDNVFQTPSFENILLSSSPDVAALNDNFLRLPVEPSKANYYEGGITKGFSDKLRLDVNVYRRDERQFADDDQLFSTGVSFPIAFDKAIIYGAEGKLDLVHWNNLSGYVSYSYMVGNAWFPVTGGLFLGDDAGDAESQLTGHFPVSQDQRSTLRTRFQYQIIPRIWAAAGADYGTGLPFEFQGTEEDALAQYGPQVVDRLNFDRGRIKPMLSVNASLGADLYTNDKMTVHLQADGENLNNRLNVIDFAGLFSGNAIGPARSYFLRLSTSF